MSDPNIAAAETDDTAAATEQGQGAAPAQAGKAAPEKIDVNRALDDDDYAAQVLGGLTKPEPSSEQPAGAEAKEEAGEAPGEGEGSPGKGAAAEGEEKFVILEDAQGNRERVPVSQVQGRWRQATYLQTKYEREAAPVLRILERRKGLRKLIADEIEGRPEGLDALLTGQTSTEAKPAEIDQDVLAEARKDPRLKDFSDADLREYLQGLDALEAARSRVSARRTASQKDELSADEQRVVDAHLTAAIASEPNEAEAVETLKFVNEAILQADAAASRGELRDPEGNLIPEAAWRNFRAAINDPRQPKVFHRFFIEMGKQRRQMAASKPAAVGVPAGPGAPAGSARPRPSMRIPAAPAGSGAGAPSAHGVPSLSGLSLEERRSRIDQLLDG